MKKTVFIIIILSAILGLLSGLYIYSSYYTFKEKILTKKIVEEEMKLNFFSQAVKMNGTERLQFATLKQIEVFEKKSMAKLKWVNLNLPDVVVGAVIPVEYTFYLEFNDEWQLTLKDNTLIVKVPKIHFNTPAPNISLMELMVTKGSVFRNEEKVMESLKKSISDLLESRAKDNIKLIKETGRKHIEDFISKWIVNYYQVNKPTKIEIVFKEDEELIKTDLER